MSHNCKLHEGQFEMLSTRGSFALLQGVWLRDYEPVNQRQDHESSSGKETLGEVAPSNAYKRRIAGSNWQ